MFNEHIGQRQLFILFKLQIQGFLSAWLELIGSTHRPNGTVSTQTCTSTAEKLMFMKIIFHLNNLS